MNGPEQQGKEEMAFLCLFPLAVDKLHLSWLGPWSFSCDVVGVAICQTPPPSPAARKRTLLANFKKKKRKKGSSLLNI